MVDERSDLPRDEVHQRNRAQEYYQVFCFPIGGVEPGLAPKEVIWQRAEARLYHYEPTHEKKYLVPVLIVYAPILRPYILDLGPGNSFVEYLLGEGFDVYLLDWDNAGPEDKHLSFEDWILDYMPEAV
jgi:polyhydroxyalkanoate synthase